VLHPESLAPKIPIQEQSIDLPAGDGLYGCVGSVRGEGDYEGDEG
jgi:hypothetical protein